MPKHGDNFPEVIYRKHSPLTSSGPSPWLRHPARQLPLFIFLVFLSCLIMAVDLRYGFSWLSEIMGNISNPIVHAADLLIAPAARSAGFLQETFEARRKNVEMRIQLDDLSARIQKLSGLEAENQRLKELLDLKAEVAPQAIAVEILRYRDEPANRLMTLKGGRQRGLETGQPVLSRGGQLLGRIVSVNDFISTVTLITDPSVSIGVTLEKSQSQGILYNRNGKLFLRVDRAEIVHEGERALTSHLSDLYPEGLAVGTAQGDASPTDKDPFVAMELGLMRHYVVSPSLPLSDWPELREALCLPQWTSEAAETAGSEKR